MFIDIAKVRIFNYILCRYVYQDTASLKQYSAFPPCEILLWKKDYLLLLWIHTYGHIRQGCLTGTGAIGLTLAFCYIKHPTTSHILEPEKGVQDRDTQLHQRILWDVITWQTASLCCMPLEEAIYCRASHPIKYSSRQRKDINSQCTKV